MIFVPVKGIETHLIFSMSEEKESKRMKTEKPRSHRRATCNSNSIAGPVAVTKPHHARPRHDSSRMTSYHTPTTVLHTVTLIARPYLP